MEDINREIPFEPTENDIKECIKYDDSYPSKLLDDRVSKLLKKYYNIIYISENRKIYHYEKGVYIDGDEFIKHKLYHLFSKYSTKEDEQLVNKRAISEIVDRTCAFSSRSINDFRVKEPILNLKEGIFNLDTHELKPHSPLIMSTSQINAKYDPDIECPGIMEKLDYHVDKKYHDCLFEMIGYVLWPYSNYQKAFMLFGEKRTFKGTLLRVIEAMIGEHNCSNISLHSLMIDRFAVAQLHGKMLNCSGDLSPQPISDVELFKNLTGEDKVAGQHKFGQIFKFGYDGKLIFGTNQIPGIKVYDEAYCSRWITIPFENSVLGKEDPKLTAKLTVSSELSGLLNLALKGLKRLQETNGKFSYDLKYGLSLFKKQSNPIIAFLEERCSPSKGCITKRQLVLEYNGWAKENGLPPASMKGFGATMIDQTIIPVETYHSSVHGGRIEAWRGIMLNKKK